MALTDSENPSNAQRPVPVPPFSGPRPIPHDYLARLPVLHAEAAENARLGGFIGHSAQAAGLLMLAGAATLLLGGGSLQSNFVWSLLVLAGITAITLNHIRGQARSAPRRVRLEDAAADLRAMLLYTGFAWGAGAFLTLPADTGILLAIAFAMVPALLLAVLLRDEGGIAAFTAPAAALTAAAALFKHWPGDEIIAPVILATGIAVIVFAHLRTGRTPAGQHSAA